MGAVSSMFYSGPNDVLANFSEKEFRTCVGTFKYYFKDRISQQNSENNAIINYSLKLTNFTHMHDTFEMLTAGFLTLFLYRSPVGTRTEDLFVNYLGKKRGPTIYSCAVFAFMIFVWRKMDRYPRLNVNKLVNPYDPNGEMMLQIIMKLYPHKVNHKYVDEMRYKYGMKMQSNMGYTQKYPYQVNETMHDQLQQQFQQQMGVYQNQPNATHHQLSNPSTGMVPPGAHGQGMAHPGMHGQGMAHPGMHGQGMNPQGQMIHHPQMQNINPNVPIYGGQPAQQHQIAQVAQTPQKESGVHQNSQPKNTTQTSSNKTPKNAQSKEKSNQSALEELKTKTHDSPYLSPNKALSGNHNTQYYIPEESKLNTSNLEQKHSPYLMNGATGFSGSYMSVPHHKEQVHHINYKGVYSNISREVKNDK
ncbi:unnamed protein product [Moneuplotes crassus]|uniref:Uncharacterized protein n=1 Tax=Euplotes crassus TaxID=5936 RepID=A0AAD1UG55_EUPCR|nr:unnamed protein product [Moneuplotes crassus]